MSDRDYRAEFMAKGLTLGRGDQARLDSDGHADQQAGKPDPRAEYLARLQQAGMGGHNQDRADSVIAKRVHRQDSCGYICFD